MPYYKEGNILFVHIPKTGGSVIENELKKKYSQTLYSSWKNNILPPPFNIKSLQHQNYTTLHEYRDKLNIDFNNIKVFAIVRNPYDRVISDLFWQRLLKKNASAENVYKVLCKYVKGIRVRDGHHLPQYTYVTNINGKIAPRIKIFKTENLNNANDLINKQLGVNINIKRKGVNKDYSKYLNADSIKLINKVYAKDFIFFKYKKR